MLGLGVVFSAIMYLGSPLFTSLSGGDAKLIPIMHSLSLAVLVFPVMSVIRGIFKGTITLSPMPLVRLLSN